MDWVGLIGMKFPGTARVRAAILDFLHWSVSPRGVKIWGAFLPTLQWKLHRKPLSDLTQVRRLGVLRYDGMGDMVLTSGMLRELRRQLPNARITLICRTPWASWMRTCPWVDEVVDLELTFPVSWYEWRRMLQLFRFARTELWPRDLEVLLQPGTLYWYFPSRALAWFSGVPVRMGWEDPDCGVDTGGSFYTHNLPFANGLHETEKCFRMLEAMGLRAEGRKLDPWWTTEDATDGKALIDAARRGCRKIIALGLACSEEPRRWPIERYRDVVLELLNLEEVAFLVFGGKDVQVDCAWLAAEIPGRVTYSGADRSLGCLWAAIAGCDLYLGNDTGFMHMAAAAKVPVVAIFGVPIGARSGTRGDPAHTGPHDTRCCVVRPPEGTPSHWELDAKLVTTQSVLIACKQMLGLRE